MFKQHELSLALEESMLVRAVVVTICGECVKIGHNLSNSSFIIILPYHMIIHNLSSYYSIVNQPNKQ